MNTEVRHASAELKVSNLQTTELLSPETVEEEDRENRAIAFPFESPRIGCLQQRSSLTVPDRRRLSFVRFGPWTLDTFHRIVGDGVRLAQMLEQ